MFKTRIRFRSYEFELDYVAEYNTGEIQNKTLWQTMEYWSDCGRSCGLRGFLPVSGSRRKMTRFIKRFRSIEDVEKYKEEQRVVRDHSLKGREDWVQRRTGKSAVIFEG